MVKTVKCHVYPNPESSVVLILDNHTSSILVKIYSFCKAHSIYIVSIPPHTSHRVQPLDLTFFSPLIEAYNKECELYLRFSIKFQWKNKLQALYLLQFVPSTQKNLKIKIFASSRVSFSRHWKRSRRSECHLHRAARRSGY